ncbi:MAG TPA: DUF2207 domain-containing protein [Acidimicrobiia bacterium]|jgi:hypothetical protein|nr:DUF2207 domain-containing protein [Acidimicrobiia bacterium]
MLGVADWTPTAVTLGVLALVTLAGYFTVLAILVALTRPRRPDPAPASMDIPGDEPPAVAGFLTNTWKVPRSAVPATLIDLAARGICDIEQVAPDEFNVRLRDRTPAELTAYEQRVYDHVRSLADTRGVVPCRALTTGPEAQSKNWWKSFRSEVVSDAKQRGLSRNRWQRSQLVLLGVIAALPAILGFIAVAVAYSHDASSSSNDDPTLLPLAAWFVLVSMPLWFRAQRETMRGSQMASRWLGLGHYLADDDSFNDAPVASVAIWKRYLSYGAALGVAPVAVAALPMGSESVHRAWSKESGRWRLVHITYRRWPPRYGQSPRTIITHAVLTGLPAAIVVAFSAVFFARVSSASTSTDADRQLRNIGMLVLAAAFVIAVLFLVAAVVYLAYAVDDRRNETKMRGRILRRRVKRSDNRVDTWLAIDAGEDAVSTLRALLIPGEAPSELAAGCLVDLSVTRHFKYVSSIARVPEAGSDVPAQGATTS